MDNKAEVREFLMSRRAKVTPEQAGLPAGPNRRVAGLRRTEVAALADVSVEYYAKLERGVLAGVSPSILDAIARALHPAYDVPNFHRIVAHGSTFPLEYLRLTIDPRADAVHGDSAFGPFRWTRVIQ